MQSFCLPVVQFLTQKKKKRRNFSLISILSLHLLTAVVLSLFDVENVGKKIIEKKSSNKRKESFISAHFIVLFYFNKEGEEVDEIFVFLHLYTPEVVMISSICPR